MLIRYILEGVVTSANYRYVASFHRQLAFRVCGVGTVAKFYELIYRSQAQGKAYNKLFSSHENIRYCVASFIEDLHVNFSLHLPLPLLCLFSSSTAIGDHLTIIKERQWAKIAEKNNIIILATCRAQMRNLYDGNSSRSMPHYFLHALLMRGPTF